MSFLKLVFNFVPDFIFYPIDDVPFTWIQHANVKVDIKYPRYLFNIIPTTLRVPNTKCCDNIPLLKIKHNYFRNSSLPFSMAEWNKVPRKIRNPANIDVFKKIFLEFTNVLLIAFSIFKTPIVKSY